MKLMNGLWISKSRNDGAFYTNITGSEICIQPSMTDEYNLCKKLYRVFKSKKISNYDKLSVFQVYTQDLKHSIKATSNQICDDNVQETIHEESNRQRLLENLQKLIDFFSEFSFTPNYRFTNTFSRILTSSGRRDAIAYVRNYFNLTDNSYSNQIVEKMKSQEFKDICDALQNIQTSKVINSRFKLYYGAQGTGKTTEAMKESNNVCMVCHSAMLPSDLMEDFDFEDGKAKFKPSALCKAMTEGHTIVLDEINLLPFESLRFLQSILDGKTSFIYKGQTIEIKDGFKIIGTMNLQVNGMIYPLPEPLVDRAEDLKEYKLTAEQLLGAIN